MKITLYALLLGVTKAETTEEAAPNPCENDQTKIARVTLEGLEAHL